MDQTRKLRIDRQAILRFLLTIFFGGAALVFIIIVLDAGSWGPGLHSLDYVLMGFYTILGGVNVIGYFRTRNKFYLGMGIALLLFTPYIVVGQSEYSDFRFVFYAVWGVLFITAGPVRRRFNPHFRQVLELAAKPVTESRDGFTARPFAAGKTGSGQDEIIRFGKFLMKHGIVYTHFRKDRVILTVGGLSWWHFLSGKQNWQKVTYVSFDKDGNITVQISHNDYLKFKDQITFDQLCASLGDLMLRFLSYFHAGEEEKILEIIDEEMLRSHWFFSRFSGVSPVVTV